MLPATHCQHLQHHATNDHFNHTMIKQWKRLFVEKVAKSSESESVTIAANKHRKTIYSNVYVTIGLYIDIDRCYQLRYVLDDMRKLHTNNMYTVVPH